MSNHHIDAPMPLSEIESILTWVDSFKLSRPTKKINRDFSDAVLLAEILSIHYPKLVEMHNYPPRNSHALKLNNWSTLNKKVLKKLKINICRDTMEQLASCAPGVIERVLVMVREKIRHDTEAAKPNKEGDHLSSGGSYYEASGNDDQVLMVPIKTRVNGVLETIQLKVVSHDCYLNMKQELDDAKASIELLKQKVDHLDNMLKVKEERLEELQTQLERRKTRRNTDFYQTHTAVQFDTPLQLPTKPIQLPSKMDETLIKLPTKIPSLRSVDSMKSIKNEELKLATSKTDITQKSSKQSNLTESVLSKPNLLAENINDTKNKADNIGSNIFKEIEIVNDKNVDNFEDSDEFKDSEQVIVTTVEDSIHMEINGILTDIVKDSN